MEEERKSFYIFQFVPLLTAEALLADQKLKSYSSHAIFASASKWTEMQKREISWTILSFFNLPVGVNWIIQTMQPMVMPFAFDGRLIYTFSIQKEKSID